MKKITCSLLILVICGLSEMSFANASTSTNGFNHHSEATVFWGKGKTKKKRAGKRKKNGRYKKRRGLFGKKNDCGCPKH